MAKKRPRTGLPKKKGKEYLKELSTCLDVINDNIGQEGYGARGIVSFIGAIEHLNENIHDGKKVTNWFNDMNNKTLPNIQEAMEGIWEQLASLDYEIQLLERSSDN